MYSAVIDIAAKMTANTGSGLVSVCATWPKNTPMARETTKERKASMCALLGVCMCVSVGADTSPAPTVVLALASGVDG